VKKDRPFVARISAKGELYIAAPKGLEAKGLVTEVRCRRRTRRNGLLLATTVAQKTVTRPERFVKRNVHSLFVINISRTEPESRAILGFDGRGVASTS